MKYAAALFLLACTRYVSVAPPEAQPNYAKVAKSVLRLRLYCDGELEGYGSATAISPWVAVTAAHVQCDDKTQESTYEAVLVDGGVVQMTVGEQAPAGVDVLLLESLGGKFEHYAKLAEGDPMPWDHVFGITGDGGMDEVGFPAFYLKHGYVTEVSWNKIKVGGHCVPGNSGSAFFNDQGEIVGILSAGVWNAGMENWCEGYRPVAWLSLVAP